MPADEWDRYFINIGFSVPLEDKKKKTHPTIHLKSSLKSSL